MSRLEYNFIEDQNLLIRRFYNDMCLDDLIFSWRDILELKITDRIPTGLITDFRKANLNIDVEEVEKFITYINENINSIQNIRVAVLTDNPQQAVVSMLAKDSLINDNLNLFAEIFSTEVAALKWIQVP